MNKIIIDRDILQKMLDSNNKNYVQTVIGRALVHLFNRQTDSEKDHDSTDEKNSIGFTGSDAFSVV